MKILRYITVLGGAVAIEYGLWAVYHPLAFLFGGVGAVYIGLLVDKAKAVTEPDRGGEPWT